MLSLLFLITFLVPKFIGGNAEEYSSTCPLGSSVLLRGDENGRFVKLNLTSENSTDFFNNTFLARECGCAQSISHQYCVENQGDTCGIPRDDSLPVGCFFSDSRTVFIRNAWPVVLLWYGALFLFLIGTENGKNARNFLISFCSKSRNLAIADQVVAREIQLRDQMRLAAMAQQRRVMELARVRREEENPTLILKTKRYCSPQKKSPSKKDSSNTLFTSEAKTPDEKGLSIRGSDDVQLNTPSTEPNTPTNNEGSCSFVYNENENETEEEVTCTICIAPIKDGDRVGALPCDHLFHSSCLKQWIKRRNVCPLCQEPDIATPQRNSSQETPSATATATATDAQNSSPTRLNFQERQNSNNLHSVGQLIVAHSFSDWNTRRRPLTLNTDTDLLIGSPVPPPPPRGRDRRMERLTLNDDGDVQVTPHQREETRRDNRRTRGRAIRLVINQRNRRRRRNNNRNQRDPARPEQSRRPSAGQQEPTWLRSRRSPDEDV